MAGATRLGWVLLVIAAAASEVEAARAQSHSVRGRGGAEPRRTAAPGFIVLMGNKQPAATAGPVTTDLKTAFPRNAAARAAQRAVGGDALLQPSSAAAQSTAAATVDDYSAQLKRDHVDVVATALGLDRASILSASEAGPSARPAAAAAPRIVHHYTLATNGFAVYGVSAAQVEALRNHPAVSMVVPDKPQYIRSYTTPKFLNLSSVWGEFGGAAAAGSDILIGVIDTGAGGLL